MLNYPTKLNNKLASLASAVASADTHPTRQSYEVYGLLASRIDKQLMIYNRLVEKALPEFNAFVKDKQIPAVLLDTKP